jgi:hypothetical protein
VIGFHSTMDRPDSVNRVAPPTTRVKKIIAAVTSNHSRTLNGLIPDDLAVAGIKADPAYQTRVQTTKMRTSHLSRLSDTGDDLNRNAFC